MKIVQELLGHKDRVWQLSWSPTSMNLVSCSGDKSIRIWEGSTIDQLTCTKTLDVAHRRTVRAIKWNPDGEVLASGSFDSTTAIWDKADGDYECVATLEGHENEVKSVDWSCSGNLLATCSRDKSVWIWEAMGDGDFECILASSSYDDTIRLWKDNDDDWYCFQTLTGHTSTVWSIDFDATGTMLASVSDDLSLRIWKQVDGDYKPFTMFENLHQRTIYSVSWSKKHNLIATCGGDNKIHILELVGENLVIKDTIVDAHGISDINFVLWCPIKGYEDVLASCGDDCAIRIWKL